MKFLRRVVSSRKVEQQQQQQQQQQHQTLDDYDEESSRDSSFLQQQQQPREDSKATLNASDSSSTGSANATEWILDISNDFDNPSPKHTLTETHKENEKKVQNNQNIIFLPKESLNPLNHSKTTELNEPVWKRRYRAHQDALQYETRSSSTSSANHKKLNDTNVQPKMVVSRNQHDANVVVVLVDEEIKQNTSRFHSNLNDTVVVESKEDQRKQDTDHENYQDSFHDGRKTTYDNLVQDNPTFQPPITKQQQQQVMTAALDGDEARNWEESKTSPQQRTKDLLKKVMDPSFRKSIMTNPKKAWKSVAACHRPNLDKVHLEHDETNNEKNNNKNHTSQSEVPYWKRVGTNLFTTQENKKDADTSFESMSSGGSEEIVTFLKHAGTTLTVFVKETTSACIHPRFDEDYDDDAFSLDDGDYQSYNDSTTYDSHIDGESRASTRNDEQRRRHHRRWQEDYSKDDGETDILEEDGTVNLAHMGHYQSTLKDGV